MSPPIPALTKVHGDEPGLVEWQCVSLVADQVQNLERYREFLAIGRFCFPDEIVVKVDAGCSRLTAASRWSANPISTGRSGRFHGCGASIR